MAPNVKALTMGPFRSSHRHGPPLLGRVQGCPCSPTSSLVCSPPTPCLPRPQLWFPLPVAYLVANACSVPQQADDTCARQRAVRRRRVTGSPRHRSFLRGEARASQVARPSSSYVLWSNTPPDTAPSSPNSRRGPLLPSQYFSTLGIRKAYRFRGRSPTARTFACLRIADSISEAVARLATGWAGSPLAGRVSHPLDDEQNFMEDLRPPIPIDPQGLVALKCLSV
jgi:hypothetical protein